MVRLLRQVISFLSFVIIIIPVSAKEPTDISDWQSYYNAESHFSFKYPKDWEVVDDFFYKTDYVATIQRIEKTGDMLKDSVDWIRINPPQFMVGDGKCIDVDKQRICTYSKDPRVLDNLEKLAASFMVKRGTDVSTLSGHDPRRGSVTEADFFLYSCVHEYMKAHSIKIFDGSMAYAVEYMDASASKINQIYNDAKDYALTIRAPDYSDQEHGLPAVLVLCKEKARGYVRPMQLDAMQRK